MELVVRDFEVPIQISDHGGEGMNATFYTLQGEAQNSIDIIQTM